MVNMFVGQWSLKRFLIFNTWNKNFFFHFTFSQQKKSNFSFILESFLRLYNLFSQSIGRAVNGVNYSLYSPEVSIHSQSSSAINKVNLLTIFRRFHFSIEQKKKKMRTIHCLASKWINLWIINVCLSIFFSVRSWK